MKFKGKNKAGTFISKHAYVNLGFSVWGFQQEVCGVYFNK